MNVFMPNKALHATAAKRFSLAVSSSPAAVVAGASALPAAVRELGSLAVESCAFSNQFYFCPACY